MAHSVCSFHSTCLNKLSHSLAKSAHLPPSVNTSSFTKGYHAGLTVRKASFLSFESLVVPGGRRIMGSHGDVNRVSAIMSKGNGPATVQDETDDSSQVFEVPVESTYPTYEGSTRYVLNDRGLITSHEETWEISVWTAFIEFLLPSWRLP